MILIILPYFIPRCATHVILCWMFYESIIYNVLVATRWVMQRASVVAVGWVEPNWLAAATAVAASPKPRVAAWVSAVVQMPSVWRSQCREEGGHSTCRKHEDWSLRPKCTWAFLGTYLVMDCCTMLYRSLSWFSLKEKVVLKWLQLQESVFLISQFECFRHFSFLKLRNTWICTTTSARYLHQIHLCLEALDSISKLALQPRDLAGCTCYIGLSTTTDIY